MTPRIYCPKCGYEPPPTDRWMCAPGCGHIWNTFSTHGVCPKCKKTWHVTSCPRCFMWSRHDDWYHDDGLPQRPSEIEKIRKAESN